MEHCLCLISVVPPTPDFRPTIKAIADTVLRNAFGLKGVCARVENCGDSAEVDHCRVCVVYEDQIDFDALCGIGDVFVGVIQRILGRTAHSMGWESEYVELQPWGFQCSGIVYLRTLAALRRFSSPHYSGNLLTVSRCDGRPVLRLVVGTPLGSSTKFSPSTVAGQVQKVVRLKNSGQRIKIRSSAYRRRTLAVGAALNSETLVGKSVLAYVRPVRGGAYYLADLVTTPQLTLF